MTTALLCIGGSVPRLAPYRNRCAVCFQAPAVFQHAAVGPFNSTLRSKGHTTQGMHLKVFISRLFFMRIHIFTFVAKVSFEALVPSAGIEIKMHLGNSNTSLGFLQLQLLSAEAHLFLPY